MTPLEAPLRREHRIGDQACTPCIARGGLNLVQEGERKGIRLCWDDLVSGDAAVARALQASLEDR